MIDIPEKIFIQFWNEDGEVNFIPDMVWCRERENKADVEYIRVRKNSEINSYMLDVFREDGSSKRMVVSSLKKLNDTKRTVPKHLPIHVYHLKFERELSRLKGD